MKYFKAKLTHDNGTSTLKTCASSREAAIKKICNAESCPESAVVLSEITKDEFRSEVGSTKILELHNNFILLHEFQHPGEPIKQWVRDDLDYTGNYHDDWNTLMEVVEKIVNDAHKFILDPMEEGVKIKVFKDSVLELDIEHWNGTLIECTYLAVVDFVKWYNQQ